MKTKDNLTKENNNMNSNEKNRAVIYARCADKNCELAKIVDQEHICTLYAEEHEYTVMNTYIDIGKSSNESNLEKMIADSKENKFDIVLVDSMEKISRSLCKYFEIEDFLFQNDVVIIEVRSAYNRNIPSSYDILRKKLKKFLDIKVTIEEKESEEGGEVNESSNLCSI